MSAAPNAIVTRRDPLTGHVGHLTPEQEQTLSQLKSDLQNVGCFVPERHDDSILLRFLRARKFDLAKSRKMIIECEEWRKNFGVDDIVNNFDFPEQAEVTKYYPQYFHKTDKECRPVYIERVGNVDINALREVTTQERLLQNYVNGYERFLHERLPACSAAAGRPVEVSCGIGILDIKGADLGSFSIVKDYVFEATKIAQKYYPETMGKYYIINAPPLFMVTWSIVKLLLDESLLSRISILGSDYKETLLEQISAENLPVDLGGTCNCPGGCSFSDQGPWNDPKYTDLAKSKTAKATAATSAPEATPA
ncbi:cytosolic factor, phosphatidylinositol/phosphatidylcholine transfer protein [Ceratobasidium sp. 423]|nr:cytosolic factor, phosphatidylinositol/phosphatidylcholine transfer protein [Ceratobasidium sp. 423]